MQTAAAKSRLLTGHSSSGEIADSHVVVSQGRLFQHLVASRLAQVLNTREAFLNLIDALIGFAEQAYSRRDPDALEEISSALINLPIETARQVGLYYHALAINRRGSRDEAESLLKIVVDDAPIAYRARAIQTLGTNLHDRGELSEALRSQSEALRMASGSDAHALQTRLIAGFEISIIKSLDGDHKGALSGLRCLSPLVDLVGKQKPLYFYLYCNAVAVELGELDRINEAEAACQVALTYPFAAAYPEWTETRQELEAKRTSATPSIVAFDRPPEAARSPQVEPQRKPKRLRAVALSCRASNKASLQRSILQVPATATTAPGAVSILDRVIICIGPRAPPGYR